MSKSWSAQEYDNFCAGSEVPTLPCMCHVVNNWCSGRSRMTFRHCNLNHFYLRPQINLKRNFSDLSFVTKEPGNSYRSSKLLIVLGKSVSIFFNVIEVPVSQYTKAEKSQRNQSLSFLTTTTMSFGELISGSLFLCLVVWFLAYIGKHTHTASTIFGRISTCNWRAWGP